MKKLSIKKMADTISAKRKEKKLTQIQLAELTGIKDVYKRQAQNTGGHALQQRFCRSGHINLRVGNTVQNFNDCLKGVSHGSFLLHIRDMNQFRFTVLKVFDCHLHDSLCILRCSFSAETNKLRIRHLCDGGGCRCV